MKLLQSNSPANEQTLGIRTAKEFLELLKTDLEHGAEISNESLQSILEITALIKKLDVKKATLSYRAVIILRDSIKLNQSSPTVLLQQLNNLIFCLASDIDKLSAYESAVGLLKEIGSMVSHNTKLKNNVDELNKLLLDVIFEEENEFIAELNKLVDKDKDPALYEQIRWLSMLDEDEREVELKTIFSKIPEYRGARVDGSAYEFAEKHWGVWLKLKWAGRKHMRNRGGNRFINQLSREIENLSMDFDQFAPTDKKLTDMEASRVSAKSFRASKAVKLREYRATR